MATRAPLSTGFKLFLILSLALLPLCAIAFIATLQSNRTADIDSRAQMRVALAESSRKLAAAIASDLSFVRGTLRALAAAPEDRSICARLADILATEQTAMPRYALFGPNATPVCASAGFTPGRPSTIAMLTNPEPRIALADDGLAVSVPAQDGVYTAIVAYPLRALAAIAEPGGFPRPYTLVIDSGGQTLPLIDRRRGDIVAGYDTVAEATGIAELNMTLTVARNPFSAAETVSLLLPFLMWAAAAAIGWLVVDRLLIRPLSDFEREVSAYRPGTVVTPRVASAHELNQLSRTFQDITRRISTHEAELAEGLARQIRLTREVHHRVKNNLQVVASLINLHARGQKNPEVVAAYASIQRRVEALAVVLRNHFAELEENRGISLRAMIGELAQNIRSSLPEGAPAPPISLNIGSAYASQDVAVPIAFLLTELIERAMSNDARAPIAITLVAGVPGKARLAIVSPALTRSPLDPPPHAGSARVLEGLSRQLRSPLENDAPAGKYALDIAVMIDETAAGD